MFDFAVDLGQHEAQSHFNAEASKVMLPSGNVDWHSSNGNPNMRFITIIANSNSMSCLTKYTND